MQAYRPLIYLALFGVTLSLVSFVVWHNTNRDADDVRFGRIVDADTESITISNRQHLETIVFISPTTTLHHKEETKVVADLEVGDFIQVTGPLIDGESMYGEHIRQLRAPERERPQP